MCTSLIKLSTNIKSGTTIIGTVPLNFRPYKTIEIPVTGASAEVAHTVLCNIDINSDGIIKLYSSVQLTNVDFRINSCWFNK